MLNFQVFLPTNRIADGQAFYIHYAGGIRLAQRTKSEWLIEPIYHEGKPCAAGSITRDEATNLLAENTVEACAF